MNKGYRLDHDTQLIVCDSSPSIDDTKNSAKKPKNQTCDSCNERNILHGEKQARPYGLTESRSGCLIPVVNVGYPPKRTDPQC
jgi:hypothetical protein